MAQEDSQRVFIDISAVRLIHSIGLLFDVGSSMNQSIGYMEMTKLQAVDTAGKRFIQSMPLTPDVWDEAGVFTFSGGFRTRQDFTTNKTALINALPRVTSSNTAMYDGCVELINLLKSRKYVKVIILLSDGQDNYSSRYKKNDVITQANNYNIKIYTVGVGTSIDATTLSQIADSTGGEFFRANTYQDLIDIYEHIFKLLTNRQTKFFDLTGKCNIPELTFGCDTERLITPGDTLSFQFQLKAVSNILTLNSEYKLVLNYNPSLLLPLDSNITSNKNGKLEITRMNKVNLDSFPLTNVKFMALLSDIQCSNISVESLEWTTAGYPLIPSNSTCNVCVRVCAGSLRAVQDYQPLYLYQNSPNPFSNSTEISFEANEDGHYSLNIFDNYGRAVKKVFDCEYKPGSYSTNIDAEGLSAGTYLYVFRSPSTVLSRMMIVTK